MKTPESFERDVQIDIARMMAEGERILDMAPPVVTLAASMSDASQAMRRATLRIQRDDEVLAEIYAMFVNEMDVTDSGPNQAMRICSLIEYARGQRQAP